MTDEAIVRAARRVLLAQGVSATTADIAAEVGLSEAAVFKRFGTKAALFDQAMRMGMADCFVDPAACAGEGTLRQRLTSVGNGLLSSFRVLLPMMMMSWSSRPRSRRMPIAAPLFGVVERVDQFLVTATEQAQLRPGRTRIAAEMLVGAIHYFAALEVLAPAALQLEPSTFVEGVVDVLLRGLDGRSASPRAPRAKASRLANTHRVSPQRSPRGPR